MILDFGVMISCTSVSGHRHFGGACCLCLLYQTVLESEMGWSCSPRRRGEEEINFSGCIFLRNVMFNYKAIQCHNLEDNSLNNHHCENIRTYTMLLWIWDAYFSHWKIEVHLKFAELFTSWKTVHGVAWKEPNINTFRVIKPHHPTTFNWVNPQLSVQSLPDILIVQVCPASTHGKAFYIWCCIQKKSYSVCWKDR
jgi:hypothetical protein